MLPCNISQVYGNTTAWQYAKVRTTGPAKSNFLRTKQTKIFLGSLYAVQAPHYWSSVKSRISVDNEVQVQLFPVFSPSLNIPGIPFFKKIIIESQYAQIQKGKKYSYLSLAL